MFKKFRKLTSVLIAALMLSASFASLAPVKVYAAPKVAPVYVALGDSVSFGMSATTGHGYTDLMRNYLDEMNYKANTSTAYTNLSMPGYTAEDLYNLVTDEDYAATIATADIITVNIGGNNLLQPVIAMVQSMYPATASLEELNAAVNADPTPMLTLLGYLSDPASLQSYLLLEAFIAGVGSFNFYWPQTINEIRKLAPDAEIYVNTVYNPVAQDQAFYNLLNSPLQTINSAIIGYKDIYSYSVVDVCSAFASKTQQVVDFNISSYPFNVDIHPNDVGHKLIFKTLKNKLKSTGSSYYYK